MPFAENSGEYAGGENKSTTTASNDFAMTTALHSHSSPDLTAKFQRLVDLTAALERINCKITYGAQLTPAEFESLSEYNREFGDLLGEFSLRPPARS